MKILIFYPHNFSKPRHGSHLRAMQQFQDLSRDHEVVFASTKRSSDTAWPRDRCQVLGEIPCRQLYLFEDSLRGFLSSKILWPAQKFGALCRKLLQRSELELRVVGAQNLMMQRWFSTLFEKVKPDVVVIHYTNWAFLAEDVPAGVRKILEIHDLLSLNSYLRKRVEKALEIENRRIVGVRKSDPIGYVESVNELPAAELKALTTEVDNFRQFDLIWSISSREERLIRQVFPQAAVKTIAPCFKQKRNAQPRGDYFLLPIGPNPFNTYSIQVFIEGVFRRLPAKIKKKIRVTGQAWGGYEFQWPEDLHYLGVVDNYQDLLMGARLVLAPTRVGTGQQMKIFEALACEVPVLCYRAAMPGDEVTWGEVTWGGLMAADDEDDFFCRLLRFDAGEESPCQALGSAEAMYSGSLGEMVQ